MFVGCELAALEQSYDRQQTQSVARTALPGMERHSQILHLWTQVVSKVRLALTPWLNHSWHVPLYVNARGLTTSPIYHEDRAFEIVFDLNRHVLEILSSEGMESQLPLKPGLWPASSTW